jgi:hypothetical protein
MKFFPLNIPRDLRDDSDSPPFNGRADRARPVGARSVTRSPDSGSPSLSLVERGTDRYISRSA